MTDLEESGETIRLDNGKTLPWCDDPARSIHAVNEFIPTMVRGHSYLVETMVGQAIWRTKFKWQAGPIVAHAVRRGSLPLRFAHNGKRAQRSCTNSISTTDRCSARMPSALRTSPRILPIHCLQGGHRMPIIKLTQDLIDNDQLSCPNDKRRIEYCDGHSKVAVPGLYLEVRQSGSTFYLRYKDANGQTCHQKLGRASYRPDRGKRQGEALRPRSPWVPTPVPKPRPRNPS